MKVKHVPCGPAVNESERIAFEWIKSFLNSARGEWFLLTNVSFSASDRSQSDEIDAVVIGPPGVQLVEVKHWSKSWVKRNHDSVEREADRLTEKARKVGTTLRRLISTLPSVDGAILATEVPSKVTNIEDQGPVRGVPLCTKKSLRVAIGIDARDVLTPQQIRLLCNALSPGSSARADGSLKRIAGYVLQKLLTPADQRFHRVYKATHTTRRDLVNLHLYDLSASDHDHADVMAEREWKSLLQLHGYSWAPTIVESFQVVPGYDAELKFFTMRDPFAPSMAERADDDSWDIRSKANFALNAVNALQELQGAKSSGDAPMLHRNLSPDTILVKHDNQPIFTGFEFAQIPGDVTVTAGDRLEEKTGVVAPEVRKLGRGAAGPKSDVYSLCASLTTLFQGTNDDLGSKILEALDLGTIEESVGRGEASDLAQMLSEQLGEPGANPPVPPTKYWTEGQIVQFRGNDYQIVSRLGSGGVGTAFKVVKFHRQTKDELGTYVAKVAKNRETGQIVLDAYNLAHAHLRHRSLSTIFEVAREWRDNSFVALMSWIEGEPLDEWSGRISALASDLSQDSGETLVLEWLRAACRALRVLHGNRLVHGDVSPRNMIVSGRSLVLTDYDCVTKIGEQTVAPGTVTYCSPSFLDGRAAEPSDDFYALAASFFRVLFEREPFRYDGNLSKERGLNWDGLNRSDYTQLLEFLDRATDPSPEMRITSASDALAVLSSPKSELAAGERQENEVKHLKLLLQSYPGSRWGNSETRGLDSDFAEDTYVPTELENDLFNSINERRVRLVILCGNAGDGKTALLQHLAKRLGLTAGKSAERILQGCAINGSHIKINLDGSASWEGSSANMLIDQVLEPFQDGCPAGDFVHLLAINDGRLLEWIEDKGDTGLTRDLLKLLDGRNAPSAHHIRFENLNQRSLVGKVAKDGRTIETGFLDNLIDALYGNESAVEIWAPCQLCSAQDRCEVFRAACVFGPGGLADEQVRIRARQRLIELLQAVHLRGETHITVRELRATLAYILFGIHNCNDYHYRKDEFGSPLETEPYWDRAFSPDSQARQGEVLGELPYFDPALEAHPQIDRRIMSIPTGDGADRASTPTRLNLKSKRRQVYFEWTPETIEQVAGKSDALSLAGGRHLDDFRNIAVCSDAEREELVRRLCGGISRLETLPSPAFDRPNKVPLRISPRTPTETEFWVEKSLSDFDIEITDRNQDNPHGWLHRRAYLVYRYHDSSGRKERLRLSAELFHLLFELNNGYQLGDIASADKFAHLSIFVQRLIQEDHRQIFAWTPMREEAVFEVTARTDAGADPKQLMTIAQIDWSKENHVN